MPEGSISRRGMRILIVEDMTSIRRLVRNQLVSLGFTAIEEARDGDEALQKLKIEKFSAIISDIHMPGMSGFQLLERVRTTPPHDKTPFILLTSQSDKESVIRARDAGVSCYLAKPFTTEMLESRLVLVLGVK